MNLAIIDINDLRYPAPKSFDKGHLDVGSGHRIYYEQFGNPKGEPVLFNHGGPGEGFAVNQLRIYDPTFYRIIAYDQRGCGNSKPNFADNRKAALKDNDPASLVGDIEKLRRKLKIDAWHVRGSSWGSTLSLCYAIAHPSVVKSLLVSSIYLHRHDDIDWYINQMGRFFPEAEEKILKLLPKSIADKYDRLGFLTEQIVHGQQAQALKTAQAQGEYEVAAVYLQTPPKSTARQTAKEKLENKRGMITLGALECHFMQHHPFDDDWFSRPKAAAALRRIKTIKIIQGRYDIVCPPRAAYQLHKAAPHAVLTILPLSGHATGELAMINALVNATEEIKLAVAGRS